VPDLDRCFADSRLEIVAARDWTGFCRVAYLTAKD